MRVDTKSTHLRLHFGVVHDGWEGRQLWLQLYFPNCRLTILDFSHTGFQIIQRQVADLIFQTVEIHVELLLLQGPQNEEVVAVESWFGGLSCPPFYASQIRPRCKSKIQSTR